MLSFLFSCVSCAVEAAGGGGLQLFVDAGLPVDSDLIRQYVSDALAEILANMLGEREEQSQAQVPPLPLSRPSSLVVYQSQLPQAFSFSFRYK